MCHWTGITDLDAGFTHSCGRKDMTVLYRWCIQMQRYGRLCRIVTANLMQTHVIMNEGDLIRREYFMYRTEELGRLNAKALFENCAVNDPHVTTIARMVVNGAALIRRPT